MRSSNDFIEVHGKRGSKPQLINKNAIIFVVKNMNDESDDKKAIIAVNNGDHMIKIECDDLYKDVAEELLWNPNGNAEVDKNVY